MLTGSFAASSIFVAELLTLSAFYKLVRPAEWVAAVESYSALGRVRIARSLARVAVPFAEAVAAVAIIVPATRTAGLVFAAALLVAFTAVIAADERETVSSCGCWGAARLEVPKAAYLLRNLVLLAVSGFALVAALGLDASTGRLLWQLVSAGLALPFVLLAFELPHFLHVATFRKGSRSLIWEY